MDSQPPELYALNIKKGAKHNPDSVFDRSLFPNSVSGLFGMYRVFPPSASGEEDGAKFIIVNETTSVRSARTKRRMGEVIFSAGATPLRQQSSLHRLHNKAL